MARITWTPELDAKLIACWNAGYPWKDIAQKFNSTEYAVKARHKKIKKSAEAVETKAVEPVHTPEPVSAIPDKLVEIARRTLEAYSAFIGNPVTHIIIDENKGVLLVQITNTGADGRCVELTLTRHTLQV